MNVQKESMEDYVDEDELEKANRVLVYLHDCTIK